MSTLIRSFLAVPLSAQIHQNLADFSRQYGLDSRAYGLKPVKPANIHLTLKFFGEIEFSQVEKISHSLDLVTAGLSTLTCSVSGIGAYPSWSNRPRVLWVGVKPAAPIEEVFHRVDEAMVKLGFPSEGRSFSPHLTLARVSYPTRETEGLFKILMNLKPEPFFGEMTVDRVVLFKSVLQPQGPIYTVLSSHQFSA